MSRFMKQALPTDNAYIEFRFEHSLRKYEQKPVKKIKCNEICGHCVDHHKKKNNSITPQRYHLGQSRVDKRNHGSLERQSVLQKLSESHLVSSNKTIKLSKRKPLEDKSSKLQNNLQLKMYASLLNISKCESKVQKSHEGKSQVEEQVFLNDFQISEGMQQEKLSQDDGNFVKIQITDKEKIIITEKEGKEVIQPSQSQVQHRQTGRLPTTAMDQQGNNLDQSMQVQQRRQVQQRGKDTISQEDQSEQDKLSAKIQKLSVLEAQSLSHQSIESIGESSDQYQQPKLQIQQRQQINEFSQQSQQLSRQPDITQDNVRKRSYPIEQSSILSSKLIQQHNMSESMMDKCLAFQGGRIYIDSQGQNFYISVRVFNKLRKQCQTVDDLIKVLIHQRPYLQAKKGQIQAELQQYLQYDA